MIKIGKYVVLHENVTLRPTYKKVKRFFRNNKIASLSLFLWQ
jgi:hypothetical protein